MTTQQSAELNEINEILDELVNRQLYLREQFIFWLNQQQNYINVPEIPQAHENE